MRAFGAASTFSEKLVEFWVKFCFTVSESHELHSGALTSPFSVWGIALFCLGHPTIPSRASPYSI
jgi:hypothetical protein